jgi:NADH:ubiquinone oxidoreductase subunit K
MPRVGFGEVASNLLVFQAPQLAALGLHAFPPRPLRAPFLVSTALGLLSLQLAFFASLLYWPPGNYMFAFVYVFAAMCVGAASVALRLALQRTVARSISSLQAGALAFVTPLAVAVVATKLVLFGA